jgi:hypothetical protein
MTEIASQLDLIEQKLHFIMQTLSLTRRTPNGQDESRSLTALFEEMQNHVGDAPPTLADVAQRAFAKPAGSPVGRPPNHTGPDRLTGANGDEPSPTTG